MIETALTKLLHIRVPIVQGGMQWVGVPQLAAAVSNAGGLGIVTSLIYPNPSLLREAIQTTRSLTPYPFGVNITLLPTIRDPPPDYSAYARVLVEEGVKIVETAGSCPKSMVTYLKQNGCIVIHKCTTIRHAKSAERYGVDVISIDGFECAGYPGDDDIGGLVLLAKAAKELKIPYIASGGIADGRGLAAALALGAAGVNMGTRFMCTVESPIHPTIKQQLIAASELSTTHVLRTLHNPTRVYNNTVAKEILAFEHRPGGIKSINEVKHLVTGMRGKEALEKGDVDAGIWTVGVSVGLVDDIPTCQELIQRMVLEAEGIIYGMGRLVKVDRVMANL